METNCLLYVPTLDKLFSGNIGENGEIHIFMPNHGGGVFEFLSDEFLSGFNISIYPG
jgi:hypothetical protein